jgi:hypothetical protein
VWITVVDGDEDARLVDVVDPTGLTVDGDVLTDGDVVAGLLLDVRPDDEHAASATRVEARVALDARRTISF